MSELVPASEVEAKVGAARHQTAHLGRAVSAEKITYVLHSHQCRASGLDLRQCRFSLALDRGIDAPSWEAHQDRPVFLKINHLGRLLPVDPDKAPLIATTMVKVREWVDSDDEEPEHGWEWPHPPVCIESRVEGPLRAAVLEQLGRDDEDTCEIRIVESAIEGGWSEFTIETDYAIEVWVHEGRQSQKVWESTENYQASSALARFLRWVGGDQ